MVYAETRVQGTPLAQETGVPINRHPDVLRLLSVMRSEIDAMRALIFTGANAMDIADNTVSEVNADEQKRASVLIPIIKGWITELSVFHCSNGLQVHGGMGFIEETGAAQYLRDSRILPIYEGTTAIQANDLIFRKTVRDEGRTIRNLLDEIETEIALVDECYSVPMSNAIAEVRSTLEILLSKANNSRYLAANGVNWLMQLGYLCGGWMAVKSADRAMKNVKDLSDDFVNSKKICAEIYLQHSLPHVGTFLNVINHEDNSILNMNVNWLHRQTA